MPLALALLPVVPAFAASSHRLPSSDYPPHTQVHFRDNVSNATIDCAWSFAVCDDMTGQPVTTQPSNHSKTMDTLHRSGGWEQDGTAPSNMQFVIWLNRFPSSDEARLAYDDFARAQKDGGFPKRALGVPGADGVKAWTEYMFDGSTVNVICVWIGSVELESAAYWENGMTANGVTARHYQREQVMAALAGEDTVQAASSPGGA
jgi:hypothetical protein